MTCESIGSNDGKSVRLRMTTRYFLASQSGSPDDNRLPERLKAFLHRCNHCSAWVTCSGEWLEFGYWRHCPGRFAYSSRYVGYRWYRGASHNDKTEADTFRARDSVKGVVGEVILYSSVGVNKRYFDCCIFIFDSPYCTFHVWRKDWRISISLASLIR